MSDPDNQNPTIDGGEVAFRLATTKYRWLKRLTKAGLVLVLAMTVLRLLWGWEAERRLRTEIDKCIAAGGGPVFAEDFDALARAVPDEDNAAILYEQAIEKMVFISAAGAFVPSFLQDPSLLETAADEAAELARRNAEAFALVRRARNRRLAAWSEPLEGQTTRIGAGRAGGPLNPARLLGFSGGYTVHTSGQRSLSRLLGFLTDFGIHEGRMTEAIASIQDHIAFGDAIAARTSLFDAHLGWSVQSSGVARVEKIVPRLSATTALATVLHETFPEVRPHIRALINQLLDEGTVGASLPRAFRGGLAYDLELAHEVKKNNFQGMPPHGRIFNLVAQASLAKLDLARSMRLQSLCAGAASEPSYPRFVSHLPPFLEPATTSLIGSVSRPYIEGRPDLDRLTAAQFYRLLARRRMAAIALAICLFETDHDHRPKLLIDLVPDYLPVLPVDPFSPSGEGFHYAPDAVAPRVYSVGPDGEDDGGDYESPRRGPGWRGEGDEPFYLTGQPERRIGPGTGERRR